VRARLQALWPLKLGLTLGLNLLFWLGYGLLGRRTFFPVWTPPLTALDVAIPFQPEPWAWVYLSQFLFTSTLPWLLGTRLALRRYVIGLAFLCGVSFALFFFLPVASPRPAILSESGALGWIVSYDGTFNAFPSLHAGFLAYLGALAWRMFGGEAPRWIWPAALAWAAAILYATIATRQHYALDLVAGAALGWVADRVAWRVPFAESAAMTMERSSGLASQAGCK
jgi:membrane-associated phospholipid phosphatase